MARRGHGRARRLPGAGATGRGVARDFTLRHQREGSVETYHLTFLLADYLIERHGFGTMLEYFGRLKRQPSAVAFRAAFGYSIAVFESEALAHLQGRSFTLQGRSLTARD